MCSFYSLEHNGKQNADFLKTAKWSCSQIVFFYQTSEICSALQENSNYKLLGLNTVTIWERSDRDLVQDNTSVLRDWRTNITNHKPG